MGGSSWSSAYIYQTSSGTSLFVKISRGRDQAMFKGEALGLQAMYDTKALKVPQVYGYGSIPPGGSDTHNNNNNNNNKGSFIVMEYLELGGGGSSKLDAYDFGRRMAEMHLAEPTDPTARAGKFGFPVDNTIGGTLQPNGWMDSWVDFYRERRLRHQLDLTGDAALQRAGERLLEKMGKVFFDGVMTEEIRPSVLHGDLWSGNVGAILSDDNTIVPSIFDPATYYGHMEAEWGMSWCAGFSGQFWQGYHDVIPQQPGFEDRKQLYELYHYLNHYNLFGGSYYGSAQRIIDRLLKKV